ncbi:MAG: hypothetical protein DRH43_01635 [Deltaproteobacteria bacterium]|nr:MAG: hypothetical protein DRH43_01635 [Deltaproteobacteria bacterium]
MKRLRGIPPGWPDAAFEGYAPGSRSWHAPATRDQKTETSLSKSRRVLPEARRGSVEQCGCPGLAGIIKSI